MLEIGLRPFGPHPDPAHWENVRAVVLERDQGCRLCGDSDRLECHHRSYANWGRELPSDLTTLCRDCHDLITGAQMRIRDMQRQRIATPVARAVVEKIIGETTVLRPVANSSRLIERHRQEARGELPPPVTVRRW